MDLSVVVPAYNEQERLPSMMEEAIEFLEVAKELYTNDEGDGRPFTYEIIVVDDGSKDDTTKVALRYAKKLGSNRCRVLTLAKNLGKGGAVRRGMLVARGRHLLFADADGATKFSDLAKLRAKLDEILAKSGGGCHGIVCGSRAHLEKESLARRSLFRSFLMFGFHLCVRVFGCRTIKDTQCGFKLLTRSTARSLFPSLHIERWAFDVELLKMAETLRIPTAEVPVKWTEVDGSKLDPISASVQMFKDLFFLWLLYALGIWRVAIGVSTRSSGKPDGRRGGKSD